MNAGGFWQHAGVNGLSSGDLPAAVARQLVDPVPGTTRIVSASDYAWHLREWGNAEDRPLLLLHGVASSAETFWRVGPSLAAAGWHVIAIDLPGHGLTGGWRGRQTWAQTAADVAGLIDALDLDPAELIVIGHSWGAMATASLPLAGIRPQRLVLIDPPALTDDELAQLADDPTERRYENLADAAAAIRASDVSWSERDVHAKANALTQMDESAVRAIYLENGDWDAGLAALADPEADGIPVWLIRGEPDYGGLVGGGALAKLVERIGRDHVITIGGAGHSPHRTHPEAAIRGLLSALA